MTSERKLIFGNFLIISFLVATTWAGWQMFYNFHDCENKAQDIAVIAKGQDVLLYSVFLLSEVIKPEKLQLTKRVLESGERPLQKAIEDYAENCRQKPQQLRFAFMLRGYELYLMTKQNVYKTTEAAGLDWVHKTRPIDALLRGPDD